MTEPSSEAQFVEEMSLFLEEAGLPRMAGRILGWLLVCEPARQTAGELSAALSASKGSISTMTRLLINMGLVERAGVPGRRESFYGVRADAWSELLSVQVSQVSAARALAERGLSVVPAGSGAAGRLEEMRALYSFLERELPALLARWSASRNGARAPLETLAVEVP
jgi:DNA-binding MarR family transcriptional regulator